MVQPLWPAREVILPWGNWRRTNSGNCSNRKPTRPPTYGWCTRSGKVTSVKLSRPPKIDISSGFFWGKYTEQEKLAAVDDYCTGQLGLKVVAQRHRVNVTSLRKWAALYRVHGAAGVLEKGRSPYSVEFSFGVAAHAGAFLL
ncbi:transposase [Paraburkholderia guartelaensis]|uniref:transposase n=1 Tax=Paraburkholderia guartelaensis TaxID=2546446 RepID=UPI0038BB9DE9